MPSIDVWPTYQVLHFLDTLVEAHARVSPEALEQLSEAYSFGDKVNAEIVGVLFRGAALYFTRVNSGCGGRSWWDDAAGSLALHLSKLSFNRKASKSTHCLCTAR